MKKLVSYISYCGLGVVVVLLLFTPMPLSAAILGVIERWMAEPFLLPAVAGLSLLSGALTRRVEVRRQQRCDAMRDKIKGIYREILDAYCEGGAR